MHEKKSSMEFKTVLTLWKTFEEKINALRDQKAGLFLAQRIDFAIQPGNAANLLGIMPVDSDAKEFFGAWTTLVHIFLLFGCIYICVLLVFIHDT